MTKETKLEIEERLLRIEKLIEETATAVNQLNALLANYVFETKQDLIHIRERLNELESQGELIYPSNGGK